MAIQPIDLQVLFSRMDQLGKEQASQKDGQLHAQTVQNAELAKRTETEAHTVTAAPEAGDDEVLQIKDEERRQQRGKKRKGEKKKDDEEKDTPPREVLTESYLGKKIDITG
jgi:hypothetical protein